MKSLILNVKFRQQVTSGIYGSSLSTTSDYGSYGFLNYTTTGSLQNYNYSYDMVTGNLDWRKKVIQANIQENFEYDNLDRLDRVYRGSTTLLDMAYESNKGGITTKSDAGTLNYNISGKPYALGTVNPSAGLMPTAIDSLTYTSFESVNTISEGNFSAYFTYNSDNERAKMEVKQSGNTILTRWYPGGSFIRETTGGVTKDYTFIGGDSYSAPVVAITQNSATTYYNLLRDHLGSITHVVNASNNTLLYEYSYDPWGRMRNVTSWTNYAPGSEPSLFVAGRGFTGHACPPKLKRRREHLPWFNLINMNGRVYDPLVGQFLNPDNHVQAPYFTQSLNRYGYCLNNPLKYNDPSGMYYEEKIKTTGDGAGGYRDPTSHYDYSENTYSPGSYYWKNTPHIAEWKANSNLYTYNSAGVYQNALGQTVAFNEVYYNYIVPNSEYSFSGEVAQDLISAFIQVSPSMNYTASIDGTSVDPFFKSLKLLLPVAFIMEGDLSWEAGLATSMTPGGIGIVLRGINAGTVFFYSSGGVGGGWFGAAGSINTAYFFYSGNVNKFSQYSLEGKSTVISCSAGEGASFGRSIILMKDNYGQTIIGIGTSIGAGGSPTIGSGQITIQNTHIWR